MSLFTRNLAHLIAADARSMVRSSDTAGVRTEPEIANWSPGKVCQDGAMLYVLSYPALAPDDAERIEAFRRIHEPERALLVRAHITLVFGLRSITVDNLSSRVAVLAGKTPPFAVTFDRAEQIQSPEGLHNVFLLASEGGITLESMHRELYAGPLSSELLPDRPFRGHITVATSTSSELVRAAMQEVSRIGLPIRGLINALDIVALENGRINPVVKFRLDGRVYL